MRRHEIPAPPSDSGLPHPTSTFEQFQEAGWKGMGVFMDEAVKLVVHAHDSQPFPPRAVRKLARALAPDIVHVTTDTMGVQVLTYESESRSNLSRISSFILAHSPTSV